MCEVNTVTFAVIVRKESSKFLRSFSHLLLFFFIKFLGIIVVATCDN